MIIENIPLNAISLTQFYQNIVYLSKFRIFYQEQYSSFFLLRQLQSRVTFPWSFHSILPFWKLKLLRNCYKEQTYLYVFGWKMTSYILHFPPSNISSRGGVIEWGNVQLNPRFFSSRIHFASSTNSFVAKILAFYSNGLPSIFGLNSENFAIFIFQPKRPFFSEIHENDNQRWFQDFAEISGNSS